MGFGERGGFTVDIVFVIFIVVVVIAEVVIEGTTAGVADY